MLQKVEVVDVEAKMNCPLCKKELYSNIGFGCMFCGMPLEDNEEFCSEICKEKYKNIHLLK